MSETREAVLDSELLGLSAEVTAELLRRVQVGVRTYSAHDYLQRLVPHPPATQSVPTRTFLFGPIESERRRIVRQPRQAAEAAAPLVTPQDVQLGGSADNETTRRIVHVAAALRAQKEPVEYWDFVHDPTDFTRTVENVFHLAFLIRDGHARVRLQSDSPFALVEAADPPENHVTSSSAAQRHQSIAALDYALWELLVRRYGRQTPLIPRLDTPARV